jgi:hypothetical protein
MVSLLTAAALYAQSANKKKWLTQKPVQDVLSSLSEDRLRAHVRFLASDHLEGRGAGQRGAEIAAEYIASQFQMLGLEPAGDNGTYFQKVTLTGITATPESQLSITTPKGSHDLKYRDHFIMSGQSDNQDVPIEAEVVFVGFGITAPEYNWDDYKDVDVKGKVVLYIANEPKSDDPKYFNGVFKTYHSTSSAKSELAARNGALGVISIYNPKDGGASWDQIKNFGGGERSFLEGSKRPRITMTGSIPIATINPILAEAGHDAKQLIAQAETKGFTAMPLPIKVKARVRTTVRRYSSDNVIARLPGSDPKLKEQAVLFSAHYDHMGIRPHNEGDKIYNGARDNASGTGSLIEMARSFKLAPQKPRRSLIFAAVTAEEHGLKGSEYMGQNPPIPIENIVLDLNFDSFIAGDPEELDLSGAERSDFYPAIQQVADEFGMELVPDSAPEEGYYYRSDHFSLARVGVPGFSVDAGMKFKGHDLEWGKQQSDHYRKNIYHKVNDEYTPDMDLSGYMTVARFGSVLGWIAANQPNRIAWVPGDEFEGIRLASIKDGPKSKSGGGQSSK